MRVDATPVCQILEVCGLCGAIARTAKPADRLQRAFREAKSTSIVESPANGMMLATRTPYGNGAPTPVSATVRSSLRSASKKD